MSERSDAENGNGAKRSVVTIHDVARHAGVSSMTVSRVINGAKYVSKEMQRKVNASIEALSYSPNLTARSLKSDVRIGALYSNPSSSNLGAFLMGAFRQSGASGCQFMIEPGVTEEEALRLCTINPAKQLRLDHRIGSIEVGKDADLVIWNGHPLSSYSRVETTIIEGEVYFDRARDLEQRQRLAKEKADLLAKEQKGRSE